MLRKVLAAWVYRWVPQTDVCATLKQATADLKPPRRCEDKGRTLTFKKEKRA